MKEKFGMYIRKLRNQREMTLTHLAAKLDMDSANLSKIETGKREFDEKRLSKLAEALNIELEVIQNEFLSDLIAKRLYKVENYDSVLTLAEDKIKYYKSINIQQGKLLFK